MYLGFHASRNPHAVAVQCAESGVSVGYGELDRRSIGIAQLLRDLGLGVDDAVAVLLPNSPDYLAVAWAALRSGLYLTPLNPYMTPDEIAYVVNDCGAKAVISDASYSGILEALPPRLVHCPVRLSFNGPAAGWLDLDAMLGRSSSGSLEQECVGAIHCYSSGTTGRPKGVKLARPLTPIEAGVQRDAATYARAYGLTDATVYLTPAPLFHSAVLHFSVAVLGQGGTVVLFEGKFDARRTLQAMERYRVTHSQWVPTMFSRMLQLPREELERFDLSAHVFALHGAAPCSMTLKHRMIDWWGSILIEAYGCTELYGFTMITAQEWLKHPGSVGKAALGTIHICDDSGAELPAGAIGNIYFEGEQARNFCYTSDPEKTRAAHHPLHDDWATVGDMGHLDSSGYLFLSDRKDFLIISGGINISPQAVEDSLSTHPLVDDVAVFGVPDSEMGEAVKAVVQLRDGANGSEQLAHELIEYTRGKVARHMMPRSVDFVSALPRLPNGKLYKRILRDRYRSEALRISS
jgi:long-chain acyl-CoA synthetase